MSFLFVDPMFVIMSVSERILCDSHVSWREVARQPEGGGGRAGQRADGHRSFKNPWPSNCLPGRESFYQGEQEQEPLKPSVRWEAAPPPDSRVGAEMREAAPEGPSVELSWASAPQPVLSPEEEASVDGFPAGSSLSHPSKLPSRGGASLPH